MQRLVWLWLCAICLWWLSPLPPHIELLLPSYQIASKKLEKNCSIGWDDEESSMSHISDCHSWYKGFISITGLLSRHCCLVGSLQIDVVKHSNLSFLQQCNCNEYTSATKIWWDHWEFAFHLWVFQKGCQGWTNCLKGALWSPLEDNFILKPWKTSFLVPPGIDHCRKVSSCNSS